jgi:hypothetical protein
VAEVGLAIGITCTGLTEATLHLHGARVFEITAGTRGEACRHEERQAEVHWILHENSSIDVALNRRTDVSLK